MRVVLIGRLLIGVLALRELLAQGEDVVGVVVSSLDPYPGLPSEESVRKLANRERLPVLQIPLNKVNEPDVLQAIRKLKPDLIMSAFPSVPFCQELLRIPSIGCINFHPSKLPEAKGFTTSLYHMYRGDDQNWITLHWLDEGVDTGPILSQGAAGIDREDTGFTIRRKTFEVARGLLRDALPLLRQGKAPRIEQLPVPEGRPYSFNWQPSFAEIDWTASSQQVVRRVRTLSHPKDFAFETSAAYTTFLSRRLFVWDAREDDRDARMIAGCEPGQVLAATGDGIGIRTGDGSIVATDITLDEDQDGDSLGALDLLGMRVPTVLG
jgi:methionyl-tRNA formyltransferase